MRLWRLAVGVSLACTVMLTHRDGISEDTIYICDDGNGNKHFTNLLESKTCKPFRQQTSLVYSTFRLWDGTGRNPSFADSGAYDTYIAKYGKRYNVDPNLIKAVIRAESGFNSRAVSRRGAQGLMQLMPDTARQMRVADPFHPGQNIRGGTRYLSALLTMFDGNLPLSLAAYNAGPNLVKRINQVPNYPETRRYIKRVLAFYQAYGGGRGAVATTDSRSTIRVNNLKTIN